MGKTRSLIFLVALLAISGCSGSSQVDVEGDVTYEGAPIKAGVIAFIPLEDQNLSAGGTVLEGKYTIAAKVGPKTGKYKVEIRWAKPTGEKFKSETGALLEVTGEGLPKKFNDQSELTTNLVPGKNKVDFHLKD